VWVWRGAALSGVRAVRRRGGGVAAGAGAASAGRRMRRARARWRKKKARMAGERKCVRGVRQLQLSATTVLTMQQTSTISVNTR